MLKNTFFYIIGIVFLMLAKIKNHLKGYASRSFNVSEVDKCIEYDINIVENWLSHLQKYTHDANYLAGKHVLELGPGDDLGIGLYLLSKGCSQYDACDVHDLMQYTPDSFYEQFFEKLAAINNQADIGFLKAQFIAAKQGNSSKLNYKVSHDFNLVSAFGEASVDLVFSQAAFECFDDIETTVSQLNVVCKSGAILLAEIDLQSHSRGIRDWDPNYIHRYPRWVYNLFWFRGIPNRLRPYQYKEAFERAGWTDISIVPLKKLDDLDKSYAGVYKDFADHKNQMDYLSIMFCARKG
ncbi:MAG: class I SAM-dependent methyltransferase [Methylococcaceae bacterium]|nr:class I SAM-dependent methyltransferase [Methylococcaceae bacterium]MDD1609740.1 class I SAM-dependent methyltransferase [Methylococcaceae bacterium]MDD1616082.1 class I SAM-dependent methyltransferase [Methylococcaceae bacterium]OYV18643.1 MAG: Uncharacterized protein CG439_1201 [Methylococcaceae bacterium NSP1-2]